MTDTQRKRKRACTAEHCIALSGTLRDAATEVWNAKRSQQQQDKLRQLLTRMAFLFVELRQANREAYLEADARKGEAQHVKPKLDQLNLALQNLLYEKQHFVNEIANCREFRSRSDDIKYVPLEQFEREAPEELKTGTEQTDPHRFMLNRLAFEIRERKRLAKTIDDLKAKKVALQESNLAKQTMLAGLASKLDSVAKASLPLQQFLSLPISHTIRLHSLASHLPSPLYMLYTQFVGMKEAFYPDMEVNILGNPPDNPHAFSRRQIAVPSPSKEELYRPYPLSVLVEFPAEPSSIVKAKPPPLRFEYLPLLNVAVVTVLSPAGSSNGEPELLTNLYPDDTGLDTPNPASVYLHAGSGKCAWEGPGRPYKWVQWLAGLVFSPLSTAPPLMSDIRMHAIETMRQLRQRFRARMALKLQVDSLARGQLLLPPAYASSASPRSKAALSFMPDPPSAYLLSWIPSTAAEFERHLALDPLARYAAPSTVDTPSCTAAPPTWEKHLSSFYRAVVSRDDVQLQAFVEVSMQYPLRAPFFKLAWISAPKSKASATALPAFVKERADPSALALALDSTAIVVDNNIRSIEMEVNGFCHEWIHSEDDLLFVLSLQVRRLLMCVDACVDLLRRQPSVSGMAARTAVGRARLIPLQYSASVGTWTHRVGCLSVSNPPQ